MGNLCNNYILRSGFQTVSPDAWYIHTARFGKVLTNFLYLRLYLIYVLDAKFIKFTDYYYSHSTFNVRGSFLNIFVHLYDSYSFFYGRRFLRRVFYQTYRWQMFRSVKHLRKLLIFKNKKVLRFFGFMRFLGMAFFYLPGQYSVTHLSSSNVLDGYFFKEHSLFLWLKRFFLGRSGKSNLKILYRSRLKRRRTSKYKLNESRDDFYPFGYFPWKAWVKIKYFRMKRSKVKRILRYFRKVRGQLNRRINNRMFVEFKKTLGKSFENRNPVFAILAFFSSYISAGFVSNSGYFKNKMYDWKEKLKYKLKVFSNIHSKNIKRKRKVTKSLFQFFFGIKNYLVIYKAFFNYNKKQVGNKFMSIAKFYGLNDYIDRFSNLKSRYYKNKKVTSGEFVENTVSMDLDADSLFFSKSRIRSDFYLTWFQHNKGFKSKDKLLSLKYRLRRVFYNTHVLLNQVILNRSSYFKKMYGRKVILKATRKMALLRLNKELKRIKTKLNIRKINKLVNYLGYSPMKLRYSSFIDFSKISLFFLKQRLLPNTVSRLSIEDKTEESFYFSKFFSTKYKKLSYRHNMFFDNFIAYFDKGTSINFEDSFIPKEWKRKELHYMYYFRKFYLEEDLRKFYLEALKDNVTLANLNNDLVDVVGFYSKESNDIPYKDISLLYQRYWRFLFGNIGLWDFRKSVLQNKKNKKFNNTSAIYEVFLKEINDPLINQFILESASPYKFLFNAHTAEEIEKLNENVRNAILYYASVKFSKKLKAQHKLNRFNSLKVTALFELALNDSSFLNQENKLEVLKRIKEMRSAYAFSSENIFLLSSRKVVSFNFKAITAKTNKILKSIADKDKVNKGLLVDIGEYNYGSYKLDRLAMNNIFINDIFNMAGNWNKAQLNDIKISDQKQRCFSGAKPTSYEVLSFFSLLENLLMSRFSKLLQINSKNYKAVSLKFYIREKILLSLSEYLWVFSSRTILKKELAFLLSNSSVQNDKVLVELLSNKEKQDATGNYRFLYKLNRIMSVLTYKNILLYFFRQLDGQWEHLIMYLKKRFNIYTEIEQYKVLGQKLMGYNFKAGKMKFNRFFSLFYKYRVSVNMYSSFSYFANRFRWKWSRVKASLYETLANMNTLDFSVKDLLYVKVGTVFRMNRFRRNRLRHFSAYFAYIYLLRFFKKLYGLSYSKIYKKRYINLISSNIYKFRADKNYFEVFRYTIGTFLSHLTRFNVNMFFFLQENDSNKSGFLAKMVSKMMLRGTSYRNLIKPLRLDFKSRMKKNLLGKYSDIIQNFTQFKSIRSIYKYLLYYRVRNISAMFDKTNNIYLNKVFKYKNFVYSSVLSKLNEYKDYYIFLINSKGVKSITFFSFFVNNIVLSVKTLVNININNVSIFNYFFWLRTTLFFNNLDNIAYTNKLNDFTNVSKRDTFAYFFDKIRNYDYWMKGRFIHGYKFHFSGRFKSKQRASSIWFKEGKMTLSTVGADIDFGFFMHTTWFGRSNLKIWLYKTDLYPTYLMKLL